MKIQGISHITLVCRDLERSARMMGELFGAEEVYCSGDQSFSIARETFFLMGDLWIALMEGDPATRSYNHIAFKVREEDLGEFARKIEALGLERVPSRPRHPQEGQSLYFYDYDQHLFELHTGDLDTRLKFYSQAAEEKSEVT